MNTSLRAAVWDRMFLRLFKEARDFGRDRRGVTAIEYGLIAAAISVAIVVAVLTLADEVGEMFDDTSEAVGNAMGG